ncbi:MAG: alanine--tRNA ligase [bacterium]
MNANDIRKQYLSFFQQKGHTIIPSAPVVPENDPTTLFTGSGMQPLVPYLLGEQHPAGSRLVNSQKSFRAEDIDDVGDNRHTTFFEMLGNWSLGDYFKKEQLPWIFSFLIDEVGLDPQRLYVTVFAGNEEFGIPKDEEAVSIWKELFAQKGIDASDIELVTEERGAACGMQGGRIFYYGDKNWWSRAGVPKNMPTGELGGPDSEIFYEFEHISHDSKFGKHCHPNCDCGRFLEIGNSVFMEYQKVTNGTFEKLAKQNVDFGGGLERIAAVSEGTDDIFKTDLYIPIIERIEKASGKTYSASGHDEKKAFRIIADHIRASVFVLDAGILPSNTDQGYVLRRLLRRSVLYSDILGISSMALAKISEGVIEAYGYVYGSILRNKEIIISAIIEEEKRFRKTLEKGLKELRKIAVPLLKEIENGQFSKYEQLGKQLFYLFTTHGLPLEVSLEEIDRIRNEMKFPKLLSEDQQKTATKIFWSEFKKHRELSRVGSEQKFKGGLADQGEMTVKYHTATHLLLAALRCVLGNHIEQRGSNITAERIRFDFSHTAKMAEEEKQKVENIVNDAIKANLLVAYKDMSLAEAKKSGAMGVFDDRYSEQVRVYKIGSEEKPFSFEICGGPHVEHIGNLGKFRIKKEESVAAGIRRIKAVLE